MKELQTLIEHFQNNLEYYKNNSNAYNEHSCRLEYINPLLELFGWDISNSHGLAPQYREVLSENYSAQTGRPDYSMTLRGVPKFFIEAKKPSVDISVSLESALQTRKYGWNAKHKIAVLTNFEYLIIYDSTVLPKEDDNFTVGRYRIYHCSEYIAKFNEIHSLISKESVYSGKFDNYFNDSFFEHSHKQSVDDLFLLQINKWRVSLSNELYVKDQKYHDLEVLNDVVQEFINQIIFLRICEDKNLPTYYKLQDTIANESKLKENLDELFRKADQKYNSKIFSGEYIIFDLNNNVIADIIKKLYYPQSPYLFNIIEPNMLGKIYENFLTEQLVLLENGSIALSKKKNCVDRSVVTTPIEIVRYMVEKTMLDLCSGKTPSELLQLRIADISCGSGIFLEEVLSFLENYCVGWYLEHDKNHLINVENGRYKLPFQEKKEILCSCIYGIDIDIHAVEVAKFSLLVKLIENETTPSVTGSMPILPDLDHNIFHGNSLVNNEDLQNADISERQLVDVVPFNWRNLLLGHGFDAIIGNPPYVNTEDMHKLLPPIEFDIYKKRYVTAHKQFDKYFLFIERAIEKIKSNGYVCYIVPNKFFNVGSAEKLRQMISHGRLLVRLDDFGATQLFEDKAIYSSIVLLQKKRNDEFVYSKVNSVNQLWTGQDLEEISLKTSMIDALPWRLTTDVELLSIMRKLDETAVSLEKHVDIFNGIQTSAERPTPVYWFSEDQIIDKTTDVIYIKKEGKEYKIEKDILKPYFKPTRQAEKGLNSYSVLTTDKFIIFPYDEKGQLISVDIMKEKYPFAYEYLVSHYNRLVPKCVDDNIGTRDVPGATKDTWYQYGRTQALTAFIDTPKLIVGILSKEPMYAFDSDNMLIASGGTAGYCAISHKEKSPYALEYIQAWLTNSYAERILQTFGSNFEGGFISRGTFVLSHFPFVELDFSKPEQKSIYDKVVVTMREIYSINSQLCENTTKRAESVMLRRKNELIAEIESLISKIYKFEF